MYRIDCSFCFSVMLFLPAGDATAERGAVYMAPNLTHKNSSPKGLLQSSCPEIITILLFGCLHEDVG